MSSLKEYQLRLETSDSNEILYADRKNVTVHYTDYAAYRTSTRDVWWCCLLSKRRNTMEHLKTFNRFIILDLKSAPLCRSSSDHKSKLFNLSSAATNPFTPLHHEPLTFTAAAW